MTEPRGFNGNFVGTPLIFYRYLRFTRLSHYQYRVLNYLIEKIYYNPENRHYERVELSRQFAKKAREDCALSRQHFWRAVNALIRRRIIESKVVEEEPDLLKEARTRRSLRINPEVSEWDVGRRKKRSLTRLQNEPERTLTRLRNVP